MRNLISLLFLLCAISAVAFAEESDPWGTPGALTVEPATLAASCTGTESMGLSFLDLVRGDHGLLAVMGGYPQRVIMYGRVEATSPRAFYIYTNDKEFVLVKARSGKWHLADMYADQNQFVVVNCKEN